MNTREGKRFFLLLTDLKKFFYTQNNVFKNIS